MEADFLPEDWQQGTPQTVFDSQSDQFVQVLAAIRGVKRHPDLSCAGVKVERAVYRYTGGIFKYNAIQLYKSACSDLGLHPEFVEI